MKVTIPDHGEINLPKRLSVEEARRQLSQLGFTQVDGATATVDAATGNITFARNAGGAKAL